MPRVLIVNQFANPPTRSGGTRHHAFAKGMLQCGFETTIVTSSVGYLAGDESREGGGSSQGHVEGVHYMFVPQSQLQRSLMHRFYAMLKFSASIWPGKSLNQLGPSQVVVGSSPSLFAAYAAARYARRNKIPFVLEVRDLWPLSLVEVVGVSPRHGIVKVMEWLEKWLYRNADHIVTLLPGAAEHIVSLGGDRDKVTVIPNGVDLSQWPNPKAPGTDTGPLKVMYAGAHGPANALDVIIDAAAILNDVAPDDFDFRMIGDGSEKERLIGRARSMGLGNISFEDPVPKEQVAEKLSEADVCLINVPSRSIYRYGFSPNKLFDYMAASKPVVIGTEVRGTPVENANAGFVIMPDRADRLVETLNVLRQMSHSERLDMGIRARTYIENHFDTNVLSLNLCRVLDGVILR